MTSSVMTVQLTKQEDGKVSVATIRSNKGEPHENVQPPFAGIHQLEAISLALNVIAYNKYEWDKVPEMYEALKNLGFANEQGFTDLRRGVGRQLFESIFPEGMLREALHATIDPSSEQKYVTRLELRFDAPELGSLPWELLYDEEGKGFLFSGRNTVLVRYVTCTEKALPLLTTPVLRVLLVTARPKSATDDPLWLPPLTDCEGKAVEEALAIAQEEKRVELVRLPPASEKGSTYSCLSDYLDGVRESEEESGYHVLHIDAHGGFGKRCEKCNVLNNSAAECCKRDGCGAVLSTDPQGYLAFEQANGKPDWTSAEDLANFLKGSGVRLVVLTACKSAVMSGKSIFSGMAPAIIKTGIPAVVAMQFSISDKAAYEFSYRLYRSISWHRPLTDSMASLHPNLFHDHPAEWYKPVLYLRTNDENPEGQLFKTIDSRTNDGSLGKETAKAIGGLLSRGQKTSQGQDVQNRLGYSCQQIKLMAYHKHAHDLLQQLDNEFRVVRRAVDDSSQLSLGEVAPWSKLSRNLENMKRITYKLNQHVTTGPVNDREKDWVKDISIAPEKIDQAAEANSPEQSIELLEGALISIEQAIQTWSPRMNFSMVEAMKVLNLSSLAGALRGLWLSVQDGADEVGAQELSDFSTAIESLDDTADRLQELLYRHDDWQQIEDELRPWFENIHNANKVGRFKIHWETRLRHRVLSLFPSPNLRKGIAALEAALSNSVSNDMIGAFEAFSDRVLTEFSQVDTDLKTLCDNLEDCSMRMEDVVKHYDR